MTRGTLLIPWIITLSIIIGCAGLDRKQAVPESLTKQATIPGLPDVRYRLGLDHRAKVRDAKELLRFEQDYLKKLNQELPLPPVNFLAISGGGDNGAFGAGLLCGWTVAGNRPTFKLVSGVSTGALIAPFAFLGSDYDRRLKKLYTSISREDIMERRSILSVLNSDAIADNLPLKKLIEREFDRALLDAVAVEYCKGRALLVATVDLDARQSVLWNMTKIAASQDPKAINLFRSIMVASSAISATFPPVMIDVEVQGKTYQEMHVDGGTMSQVFVYPPSVKVAAEFGERSRTAYVIRNSKLDPQWANVDRRTLTIAMRAVASLIHTQGIGNIHKIYIL
jgi:predicted patatin/cPLA2 family phospholipase